MSYDLDVIFRNWYMDLQDNKDAIQELIEEKAHSLDIIFNITAHEVPTMTIKVEKYSQ